MLDKTIVVNEQKGEESAGIEERKLSEMRHERAKSLSLFPYIRNKPKASKDE